MLVRDICTHICTQAACAFEESKPRGFSKRVRVDEQINGYRKMGKRKRQKERRVTSCVRVLRDDEKFSTRITRKLLEIFKTRLCRKAQQLTYKSAFSYFKLQIELDFDGKLELRFDFHRFSLSIIIQGRIDLSLSRLSFSSSSGCCTPRKIMKFNLRV